MSEEMKNRAVELSDEEAANAAGGIGPAGSAVCKVFFDYFAGVDFCGSACKYHGTNDCNLGYCKASLCDEVKAAYHKWIGI